MNIAINISCNHTFDQESIYDWLLNCDTCPICRIKINQDELNPNNYLQDKIDTLFEMLNSKNN